MYEFRSIEFGGAAARGWKQALDPFFAFACVQFISHY